jgi:hypothetical protein
MLPPRKALTWESKGEESSHWPVEPVCVVASQTTFIE